MPDVVDAEVAEASATILELGRTRRGTQAKAAGSTKLAENGDQPSLATQACRRYLSGAHGFAHGAVQDALDAVCEGIAVNARPNVQAVYYHLKKFTKAELDSFKEGDNKSAAKDANANENRAERPRKKRKAGRPTVAEKLEEAEEKRESEELLDEAKVAAVQMYLESLDAARTRNAKVKGVQACVNSTNALDKFRGVCLNVSAVKRYIKHILQIRNLQNICDVKIDDLPPPPRYGVHRLLIPNKVEAQIAETVECFRALKFPVFKADVMAMGESIIEEGSHVTDMWYAGFLKRWNLASSNFRPLECSREEWGTSENVKVYYDKIMELALNLNLVEKNSM